MARTPQDVTDAELAVMQLLWDGGSATIRKLADALYPDGGSSQYATVQKLLERLEGKGYVRRDRKPAIHVYEASVGREALIGRRLKAVADKLCGGSLTPLLTHLVQEARLSDDERRELRSLIDRPRKRG
jgi:predicted transcriptional regulator